MGNTNRVYRECLKPKNKDKHLDIYRQYLGQTFGGGFDFSGTNKSYSEYISKQLCETDYTNLNDGNVTSGYLQKNVHKDKLNLTNEFKQELKKACLLHNYYKLKLLKSKSSFKKNLKQHHYIQKCNLDCSFKFK